MARSSGKQISLLELQEGKRGIGCPRCHCKDWRVRDTVPHEDQIKRYRVCRNCGHVLTTAEVPIKCIKCTD